MSYLNDDTEHFGLSLSALIVFWYCFLHALQSNQGEFWSNFFTYAFAGLFVWPFLGLAIMYGYLAIRYIGLWILKNSKS